MEFEDAHRIADSLGFVLPDSNEDLTSLEALELDPASPAALKGAAKEYLKANQLEEAEEYLLRALRALPEYTDALTLLGGIYRLQRKTEEAAVKLVEALGSPLCFGGDHRKSLNWLQRLRDEDCPALSDDPLWANRHLLTFETGVKQSPDFATFELAIDKYIDRGEGVRAVRLRMLVGERMWSETTSFRERHGYTLARHQELLHQNVADAGMSIRPK